MRKLYHGKTQKTATRKARKALKENGFTYNKSTKTWIRGGGFFNIDERKLWHRNDSDNFHLVLILEA